MKKIISLFLSIIMGILFCGTVLAEDQVPTITITLNADECIVEDADGHIVPIPYSTMDLGSVSIANNYYAYWNNNGKWFNISGDQKIQFVVNLTTEETHVQMGYMDSDKTLHPQSFTRDGKKYSSTFWIDNTGYYGFYFKNNSAGTIKISSGSLSF